MSVLVGSARIDENGKISGGAAGDQTGNEVCTQEWYSKPWDFMAIHPDAEVREKHAQAVEQACANDNVGYDQGQRNTLNAQAALVDYIIKNIKTKCECDCSSLQDVAAIASGAEEASNYGSNGWTTSSMRSALKALGYVIITASEYLASSAYCVRGAIYVSEGHHTVAGLSNGSSYQKTLEKAGVSGSSGTTSSGTTSSTEVADAQYGPDNSIAGTYIVTASSLNIRYGPSTSYSVRTTVAKGGTVQCFGYYSITNGVKWLYVQVSNVTGFASSEWLTKAAGDTTATSSTNKLSVDGQIGAKTVKKLQQVLGTTADGFIDGQPSNGRQYWLSIISEACKWTGGTSATVKKWQQYLKDAGYSPSGVDGKLGKNTAKAAQKYLIAKGFSCGTAGADGKFGTNSAKALQQWLNTK